MIEEAKRQDSQNKDVKASLQQSAVVLGLFLFLIANVLLLVLQPLSKVDPESLPSAHTWVWWAGREYLQRKSAPDVMILGSSLLMNPVAGVEADYLNSDFDYVKHHESRYTADALATRLGSGPVQCFNFALPGAMLSDDFMVLRALVSQNKKPKVIVLGLGVRDFIDSGVACPAATPPFRYLKRFAQIDDIVELSMPQIWQRFEYWVGRAIYLSGKKLDLQVALSEKAKSILSPIFGQRFSACRLEEADPTKNMPGNLRSEIEEGVYVIKAHQPYAFLDNTAEYRKRFRNPNENMFAIQSQFLDKFLAEAQNAKIKVVLMNVPVTPANRALMPKGAYERYLSLLSEEAKRWNVALFDPAKTISFAGEDYGDTAHMNAVGGRKLLDAMVDSLASDRAVRLALGGMAAGHLAGKNGSM